MMLEVRDLMVRVGGFEVRDFSLEIAPGECVALMGPSGCGKTTVVEAVCGVGEGEVSGIIRLDGRDVVRSPPGERGIGWVPQDVLLFPAMTVRGHLELGPRARGWERGESPTGWTNWRKVSAWADCFTVARPDCRGGRPVVLPWVGLWPRDRASFVSMKLSRGSMRKRRERFLRWCAR